MRPKKRIMPSQVKNDNVTWKKAVMDNTGWDEQTYNKKYDVMRKRVKNYNLMYGKNYSPAEMLFYESTGKLYATTQEIISTTTYREKDFNRKIASPKPLYMEDGIITYSKGGQDIYKIERLEKDFEGLLSKSTNLRETYEKLKNEGSSYDVLYYTLANFADRLRREKEKDEHASYKSIQYDLTSDYITFK